MGYPNSWMDYFMENPTFKWMIWGYPHDLGNLHMGKMDKHGYGSSWQYSVCESKVGKWIRAASIDWK